ncbi:MAG: hypothetical protein OXC28_13560 [Defluviicoccus sp.]|nr:hypothetical protein [Defluviicoccus sp.]
MTPELIAILAVGVALAGVTLQGQRSLGARMDRLDGRMDRLEAELKEVRDRLEAEMKEVRDRLGRIEGKMDFLERYIVRRDEAGAPAE